MKKLMLLIMLLCLVPTVFVIINIDNLLAEAVIPFKPAEEAVIPFKPAEEAVIPFKPAPEWPSLKEHLIFFVRHLLEYQFSPISIDIIFQESSWGMSKEQS
jgi:hypothetical protein